MRILKTLLFVIALGCGVASAQSYPSKPIKLLNGFSAGGNADTVARFVAARLEERLGKPVIVENRPGASGTIAAAAVARSEPDGYTLLFAVAANLAVAPATMKAPPYDPAKAFTAIIEIARGPYLWLVRSDAPARTMKEFVAWAKENPGKLNYASPGIGSVHHLATEMLKRSAGIDIVHVPYKGGLYPALLTGDVQALFETMPGPIPHLQTGKIRALAVTGARRLDALPDVPTFAEQGLADIDANFWWGIVGPRGMPGAVVERLNAEIVLALRDPQIKATLAGWGVEPNPGTPEAFDLYINQQYVRWKSIVATTGLTID
ncbi:MAG TPA: tripartite tricarboxylate transporter substrate binding protein [Burkholderiaceae bacterium]|nr:tripartite tricarboxylate transporter substrate binding protein [Burkholderiaceae bacterium]